MDFEKLFDPSNEVKQQYITWGKVGDWVSGTLTEVKKTLSKLPGKEGEEVKIYVLKVNGGSFHVVDDNKNPIEPAVIPEVGDYWSIGGRKTIDDAMRRIKIGQIVGFKYKEEIKSKRKGFNATKVIKVYPGEMDMSFLDDAGEDVPE